MMADNRLHGHISPSIAFELVHHLTRTGTPVDQTGEPVDQPNGPVGMVDQLTGGQVVWWTS